MTTPTPEQLLDDEICKPVTIKLAKKEYRLDFSMASVLAFKSRTGRNVFTPEGWQGFNLKDDPEAILAFFWASLLTFQPDITFEQVARLANFRNMKLISQRCEEALQVYMPEPDPQGEEKEPTKPELQSIGSTTGA
jgi:hypothetical protein